MPAIPEITNDPTGVFNEQISSTDMSGQILDLLFGPNWDSISQIVSSGGDSTLAAASLLLTILGTLSLVALTIGTVIMTYTIFIGVIGTAHEGTPLGKRLSTLWTPIRGAFAVGLMIPTAKGLSVLMVLLLVLIGGSINLANFVFSRGIDYLRENSGQVVVRVPDGEVSNTEKVAGTILQSLAAQYHMGMRSGLPFGDTYKVIGPTETDPNYTIQFQAPNVPGVRTEDMGAVVVPCSGPSGDPVCEARKNGILAMISSLAPVARAVVANNMTDEEMSENGVSASRTINEGTIRNAVKTYSQAVSSVIPQLIQQEGSEFQEGLNRFLDQASTDGWFSAGSYYWTFTRYAEMSHKAAGALPRATSPNGDALRYVAEDDPQFFASIQNAAEAANNAVGTRISAAREGDSASSVAQKLGRIFYMAFGMLPFSEQFGTPGQVADKAMGVAQSGQDMAVVWVAKQLTESDPVAALSNWGHLTITAIEYVWHSYVLLRSVASGADAAARGIWADTFTGGLAGGAAATFLEAVRIYGTPLVGIAGALLLLGLMLAYYLPALPWVLWTGAIIGWLVLVCETLVAAPFWAMGILVPEGEGMTGQHGRQGVMLLLGILARPPLMIAGFFFAMIIMTGIGKFLGMSFLIFYGASTAGRLPSITAILAYTFILGAVVVVFAHKIFGLITHLPENVVRWIGGGQASLGEHSDESRLRAIFMAGGGRFHAAAANAFKGSGPKPGGAPGDGVGGNGGGDPPAISSDTKKLGTEETGYVPDG